MIVDALWAIVLSSSALALTMMVYQWLPRRWQGWLQGRAIDACEPIVRHWRRR